MKGMTQLSSFLNADQVDDLLVYCGSSPRQWKQEECLVCCPVHGESNPSMGISLEKQVCHCFSCSFAGGFDKLLAYSLPEKFGLKTDTKEHLRRTEFKAIIKARSFLKDRYELEYYELGQKSRNVKRYEDVVESKLIKVSGDTRIELPKYKLAPFMSGKETYQYFFDRGFTKQDMRDFMIGRDTDNKTVTIPVFYEDKKLAGVIGRYISKKRLKNQRYKIYDDFERSKVLFPLDHFKVIDDTIIIVEGQLDAIRMHKAGYVNTLSPMTVQLSRTQADWICKHCSTVIWVGDNDEMGLNGRETSRKLLKNKVMFKIVDYPNHGKDVCDWSDEEIAEMIQNAHSVLQKKLRRLN